MTTVINLAGFLYASVFAYASHELYQLVNIFYLLIFNTDGLSVVVIPLEQNLWVFIKTLGQALFSFLTAIQLYQPKVSTRTRVPNEHRLREMDGAFIKSSPHLASKLI